MGMGWELRGALADGKPGKGEERQALGCPLPCPGVSRHSLEEGLQAAGRAVPRATSPHTLCS